MDKDVADFRNAIVRRRQSALAYGDKLETVLIAPLGLREGERLLIVPHIAGFDPIDLFEDHSFIARVMAAQSKVVAIADDKQWCLHLIHPAATSRCFSRYMIPAFLLPRLFEAFEGYPERPC